MLKRISSPVRRFVVEDDDVVRLAGRRPESVDTARPEQPLSDDPIEQDARVLVQLARRGSVLRMIEDRRKPALQLPGREEERPVDIRHGFPPSGTSSSTRRPDRRRDGKPLRGPVDLEPVVERGLDTTAAGARAARCAARAAWPAVRGWPARSAAARWDSAGSTRRRPRATHRAHARSRPLIFRGDLHRRVLPARRRAADEQRRAEIRGAPSPSPRTPSRRATG